MTSSKSIKEMIFKLGADLCGIAPTERFDTAPQGFKPTDIYSDTRSVIVFAVRLPSDSIFAQSVIPYTHINSLITHKVDQLTLAISYQFDKLGIKNVIIPTDDPYEYWDSDTSTGSAILSLRHAGYMAGLGKLGKNTLLMNNEYGNMIQIGAILINLELLPDKIAEYEVCPPNCDLCLTSCPVSELDGITVNQKLCRPLSNYTTKKGYIIKKCFECRKSCPNAFGVKNGG